MHNDLLFEGMLLVVLGVVAQWVAWRVRLPSILFLLMTGIIAGPVTGILHVDLVMGDLLFPVVSLSVAIILFEGGLSLRFKDIRGSGKVVRNLVSVGVIFTWLATSLLAALLLRLDLPLALLLGATLVVTGPTVIIPLLNQIRPTPRVSSILRWEGIVIDPVGAILALLVFEEIFVADLGQGVSLAILTLIQTALIGGVIGVLTANAIIELYRRYWVPDTLQNAATVMFVVAAFTVSNLLQAESGLLTVTIMGIVMANQNRFNVKHIIEFKESLQVLLLATLFILLSARMQPESLALIASPPALMFVALVILVVRPVSVYISTIGSGLTWQQRLFVGWMAPRGIVAASVASIFALELVQSGMEEAALLVPYTFAVIIGTVIVYSLTASQLARRLGLSERNPQGLLIVGATDWVQQIAIQVQAAGFRVLLADTNQSNIEQAEAQGLPAYNGNVLSEIALDEIDLSGLGRLVAMTPNTEINALAAEHFENTFGQSSVYELRRPHYGDRSSISPNIGGLRLFHEGVTYDYLQSQFMGGAQVTTLSANLYEEMNNVLPLFVIHEEELHIWRDEAPPRLTNGSKVIVVARVRQMPAPDVALPTAVPVDA